MRCPNCEAPNEEGAALCEACGGPLTAYAGQLTGEISEATREKLARLSHQPPIVPAVTLFDLLLMVFWPVATLLGRLLTRPVTNAEGTNYASAAFGAVGLAFTALVMIPLALFLLYVAWQTWTRGAFAWMANAVILVAVIVLALIGYPTSVLFFRFLMIVVSAVALGFWLRQETREWYGV